MTDSRFSDEALDKRIENILHDKLGHFLEDISFRIGQAREVEARNLGQGSGKVYAEDLNLRDRHMITGYTMTNNSPSAGYVAWTDLHVVYNGTDTTITNGNSNKKYLWWSPTVTPTVLQSSDTKPVLGVGEVLLFTNTAGTHKVMLSDTNASLPSVLANGAVDTSSIIANAVTTNEIGPGAVTSTELGNNAVIAAKILDGAVTTLKIGNKAVTTTQLGDNAVTSGQLGGNAVTAGKIASGAINNSNVFVTGIVNSNAIGDQQVTTSKLPPGAVDATKLNVLRHFLF